MGSPPTRPGDEGVSSVVAAVLVLLLFTTMFTMWTVTSLPEWIADKEKAHMDAVEADLGALKSGLDRISVSEDGQVSQDIPLAANKVALVQRVAARGGLSIESGPTWTATFTGPTIHALDGQMAGDVDEAAAGVGHASVAELDQILLRLSTNGIGNNDEGYVEFTATDGTDTVTARLAHVGKNQASTCDESELRLVVTSTVGTQTHSILCGLQNNLPGHTLDLLQTPYGIKAALARLDEGWSFDVDDDTATGTYAAIWTDTAGATQVAGSGESVPGYTVDTAGQRLRFDVNNREFVDWSMALEMGGVALSQADGAAVVVGPTMQMDVGAQDSFSWTVMELSGEGDIRGSGRVDVNIAHVATTEIILAATGAEFTVTGEFSEAWANFFAARALEGGARVESESTAGSATLRLVDDGSTWTLRLRVVEATVEML